MRLYGTRHHGCRVDEYQWHSHRLIVIENEAVRVGVLASKGADILEFRYKARDLDVMWHAPQTLLPNEYVPTAPRLQGSFLDYYLGGWQEIFPSAGPATEISGAALGQHGETALLPWDVTVREDSPQRVEVDFTAETVRTPFRIRRRMILTANSPVLRLDEEITNLGEQDLPYQWGHHPAFGPPFLEAGCRIEMPPCDIVEPKYAEGLTRRFAVGAVSRFPSMNAKNGASSRVDEVPGKDNRTEDVVVASALTGKWCALRNPSQKLAVGLVWDTSVFANLWMWQVYGGSWGYPYFGRTYNLALEPFSSPVEPLAELVARGQAPVLKAGASRSAALECGIFEASGPVSSLDFGGAIRTE